jgi:hypothetical protein
MIEKVESIHAHSAGLTGLEVVMASDRHVDIFGFLP